MDDENNATSVTKIHFDGATFAPEYTYQIFEDEKISGFTNPRVLVEFDENYLPLIDFQYDAQDKDGESTDVVKIFEEMIPVAKTDRQEWLDSDSKLNLILQDPISEFEDYKIYATTVAQSSQLLDRIRIFVTFFIDGGSFIDQSDLDWEVYLLYKNDKLAGFCTIYPYFYYLNGSTFDESGKLLRKRISQFIVLPPYQKQSVGTKFLNGLYEYMLKDPLVREITVEDPSETFDLIRERVCVKLFAPEMEALSYPDTNKEQTLAAAQKCKIDLSIFKQIFEIFQLQKHPDAPREYEKFVKQRLYQRFYLELKSEPIEDQREKLDDVYENVLKAYRKVLGLTKQGHRAKRAKLE